MYQEAMRELGRFFAQPPTRERYEVLLEVELRTQSPGEEGCLHA